MNINNRIIDKSDLTFFQWLNIYEFMTKKEFKAAMLRGLGRCVQVVEREPE